MDNRLYAMYLRKSRKDVEAERNGIDTLARHEQMLKTFADQSQFQIGQIYREVVSGDTIAARPEMQQLLHDVENELWKGVLVVDVERLARGDTIDQGIIAQVFKYSETLIITPLKTYDPNNEYDEEFFEYGLFQARREYKAITRRQQRGRLQSLKEGKWPYNKSPFGYERYKLPEQRGWSLKVVPEEAKIVKMIFELYGEDHMGYSAIAEYLNNLNISYRGHQWSYSTIKDILVNVVYTGKVKNGERGTVKKTESGAVKISRPRNHNYEVWDGLHEAIIDDNLFKSVQDIFSTHPSKPVAGALEIRNPLAGLVYCKICGNKMIRRPQDRCKTMIKCPTKGCKCVGSYEHILEQSTIDALASYLEQLKMESTKPIKKITPLEVLDSELQTIDKEISVLQDQLNNAYDLVEQGVYTPEIFMKRNKTLQDKITGLESKRIDIQKRVDRENRILNKRQILIPKIETLLDVYDTLEVKAKNDMLTEVIESIDYEKTERSPQGGPYDNFTLELHPRIPVQ